MLGNVLMALLSWRSFERTLKQDAQLAASAA
jgi:hypothetical protein